jgi:hypothetical protein
MKLNEVILRLQEMLRNHGNRDVLKLDHNFEPVKVQDVIVTIVDPDALFMTLVPSTEISEPHRTWANRNKK